jgi:dTDP-4-amino-4,6-dideoxygalactose transaminase
LIPFNKPFITQSEQRYLEEVIKNNKFCGDGEFTRRCNEWLKNYFDTPKALFLTSCTHALELTSLLMNINEGDEIIMPSFTFVSAANAYVLRGAKIVFVDIRPDTMNVDENKIEEAITSKTKAIVLVHYAGVGCNMDKIMQIAKKHNLFVVEDAAHCINATYNGKQLGSIGTFGTLSFHETKNFQCGEGGAILVNDERFSERSEVVKDKGTNINKFKAGIVDRYSWVDIGSSYSPSEFNAAFLYAQFEITDEITKKRNLLADAYREGLSELNQKEHLELQFIPELCKPNGHIFYFKLKDYDERKRMIEHLKNNGVQAVFHYVPLHSSVGGEKYGRFHGEDVYTTKESERLLRLPLYHELELEQVNYICDKVKEFYK